VYIELGKKSFYKLSINKNLVDFFNLVLSLVIMLHMTILYRWKSAIS